VIGPVARQTTSLREQVIASLRDAILNGELQPGQKLVERELCSALDISRTTLREVLPQLQAEGLINSIAHKGPFVASIHADEVKEIYQVRRLLEALAVREFTRNASDQQIKDLREQLSALKRPEAAATLRSLLRAKAGFYSVLFDGCGNRVVNQTLRQLNNRMVLYKRLSLSVPGRLADTIKELEALVSAIEARDPEKASELCDVHVLHSEQNVLRQLSDDWNAYDIASSARTSNSPVAAMPDSRSDSSKSLESTTSR
jgi:DNA-binding GntR family transcriptional regulator